MNCKIANGVPLKNPLKLGKALLQEKKVKWLTDDVGVTYCLKIPAGIFLECKGTGTCRFEVKDTQYQELHLDSSTKSPGAKYEITVCAGALPDNCAGKPLTPPEIIVSDGKKKAKTAAVKKDAPKKKAK